MGRPKKHKRRNRVLLVLVLLLAGGYYVGNRYSKSKGYESLFSFLTSTSSNYIESKDAPIQLSIKLDEAEFAKLEAVRNEALERGVIVQPEDPYVKCKLKYNGETIKAKIRLKGKMTDHVEGDKWSFRIKTRKGDAFLGMKRFSLMHPGTRNYGYEWIYHQLSREEGIAALRYHFVNLTFNGKDLGVYALEEHFGQEIAGNNARVEGPIFRFNPNLYWYYRIHELQGLRLVEEYTKFQSAHLDPFNEGDLSKDSLLGSHFANALAMMDAFSRGQVKANAILDVEKFARRHAILDLIGGQHSMDWSDIKFYYNPQTFKVEPLAYESFSGRRVYRLLGHFKHDRDTSYIKDFHQALFNDEEFFEAYIKNLNRLSAEAYLDDFFARNDSMIQDNKAILYREFPYLKTGHETYYSNAKLIRENLKVPKFFQAYLNGVEGDTLTFSIGSISGFPSKITEVVVNDSLSINLEQPVIVPAKKELEYVKHHTISIPVAGASNLSKIEKISFKNGLLGGTETLTTEVFMRQRHESEVLAANYLNQKPNASEFPFLIINDSVAEIELMPGLHTLERDLIVPAGYTFKAGVGAHLILNNQAKVISYSKLQWIAEAENPMQVTSADGTGQGVILMHVPTRSEFNQVTFSHLQRPQNGTFQHRAAFIAIQSDVRFQNCAFDQIKAPKALRINGGRSYLMNCNFTNLAGDGLQLDFGWASLSQLNFVNLSDKGLIALGGTYTLNQAKFDQVAGVGVLVKDQGQLTLTKATGNQIPVFGEATDGARLVANDVTLTDCETAFWAHKKDEVFGPAQIEIKKLSLNAVAKKFKKGKSSSIHLDETEISKGAKIE